MGWKKLIHECDPDIQATLTESNAEPGSIWVCPFEGCGQESELLEVDANKKGKWSKIEVVRPNQIPKAPKPNKGPA